MTSNTLSRQRADLAGRSTSDRRSVERLRLLLVCGSLTLAVFGQSAGSTAADTKLDLVVSPLRFLGRALRLWDPIGNGGQLQNQAYGYLFPIGPFFAALHGLGLPAWEIQRAWESTILIAAFLGAYRLARRLGVDRFWPAVVSGLAYALAPRMLSELTSISSELMPVAALPWVLLPLVDGSRRGSPRRAAAWSGVALTFAGGVNAAATLAVLPMPALYLLTRQRGPRRRALLAWWAVAVTLACLWWAVPLIFLGRYSPPFLDWIESSSTTTLPTSLFAVLRGMDHWEAYLGPGIWPGGWILASAPLAVLATAAVAAAGLVGMARRDGVERTFLWMTLLLGLVLLTFGHVSAVAPSGAASFGRLLDGPLVPFRNIHKFDPLVRLPLALGLGQLLARVGPRIPRWGALGRGADRPIVPVRALATIGALAVAAVAISPVLTNHLVSSQRITPEPGWWRAAGAWLGHHSDGARALVVPGSTSPHYLWGGTVDNALQPVATTPWSERDAVPLSQAGYVRLLDEVEAELSSGAAQPQLAPLLARAGIGYVVLANDLDTLTSSATNLLFVRATLQDSPGIELASSFGPKLGGSLSPTVLLDSGATVPQRSVEIFRVSDWSGMVGLDPLEGAVAATGSTDALPGLITRGLPLATPVFFGHDASALKGRAALGVTTDGIRKREASFGGIIQPSVTMTAQMPYQSDRPAHDYLPDDPGPLSAYRYTGGVTDVFASSAGDAPLAYLNRGDLNGAWSALDGDPSTAWRSTGFSGGTGQWLQVDFDRAVATPTVVVSFASTGGPLPATVRVTTDAGVRNERVRSTTTPQTLALPAGSMRALRITVTGFAGDTRAASVGIASLSIPGIDPGRTLDVPSAPTTGLLAFDAADGYRSACLATWRGTVCDPSYARSGQEDVAVDRRFRAADDGEFSASATVRLRGGPQLDQLLDADAPIQATASSTYSDDPRLRPGAAVDGDPTTAWQAAAGDPHPELRVRLGARRPVADVTISTSATLPVAAPLRVTVLAGGESWTGRLPTDGVVHLPRPVVTDSVAIRIDEASVRPTTSTVSLASRLLPVGIGEVRIGGQSGRASTGPLEIDCSGGLQLRVDGRALPLRVSADRAAVLAGAPVPAKPCSDSPVALDRGEHRVVLAATARALPVSITLTGLGVDLRRAAPAAGRLTVRKWGAVTRDVHVVTDAAAVLVVRENANAGWRATLNGRQLPAVRVDGWQQGYLLPAGARGTVHLVYTPQRPFEWGLVAGLLAAVLLLILALLPGRGASPSVGEGRLPLWLCGPLSLAGFYLLGGWAGVLLLVAGAVAVRLVGRRWFAVSAWLAGVLLLAAAVEVVDVRRALLFAQQNAPVTQLLCIAGLAAGVLAASWRPRRRREP